MRRFIYWLALLALWSAPFAQPSFSDEPATPTSQATTGEDAATDEPPISDAKQQEYYELFRMLADTLDEVERNYVQEVDRRELMEAAIQGVIGKLDQYSSYIPPEELSGFRSSVESEFAGVGIQVAIDQDQLKVLSPLVGSPAYRAGVHAGDKILTIDGHTTKGITLDNAVKQLKGKIGTEVTLSVIHADETSPHTITLTRANIRVETVLGDRRKRDDSWEFLFDRDRRIGYLRISSFSRDTARELRAALDELGKDKLQGLIVDVRFNPGGLLNAAIEISDLFVDQGLIVSTEGRNAKKRVWNAKAEGTFSDFPMVVLVNRYSASASEIFAACLQDHKRAVIIGERSWGKGSVQNIIELEGGKSALKLTTASYQRPSGKPIHRFPDATEWGVSPDEGYEVKMADNEAGQFLRYRRDRDVVAFNAATGPIAEGTPPEPELAAAADNPAKPSFEDRQLQKALDYLSSELARAK